MQCPQCDLSVLVQDGTIQPHLRPDTLEPCNPKATASPKAASQADGHDAPPKKPAPKKAPSRTASKTKPRKT
jgi:hypothetical protein